MHTCVRAATMLQSILSINFNKFIVSDGKSLVGSSFADHIHFISAMTAHLVLRRQLPDILLISTLIPGVAAW